MQAMIECRHLSKTFQDADKVLTILSDVNLQVQKGEQIAIMGRSGSGKTTLLQLLGGLDTPSQGEVTISGTNLNTMTEKHLCQFRNQSLGFVFQFHHLLPEFTALENVAMPLVMGDYSVDMAKEQARDILDQVELSHRLDHKPAALSGGERQRVAIARALVNKPECLFADEPTGNLDKDTAEHILSLLQKINRARQTTLVVVTHDLSLANHLDKTYFLTHGVLSESEQAPHPISEVTNTA